MSDGNWSDYVADAGSDPAALAGASADMGDAITAAEPDLESIDTSALPEDAAAGVDANRGQFEDGHDDLEPDAEPPGPRFHFPRAVGEGELGDADHQADDAPDRHGADGGCTHDDHDKADEARKQGKQHKAVGAINAFPEWLVRPADRSPGFGLGVGRRARYVFTISLVHVAAPSFG